jgi:hypothetical protein
VRLPLISPAPSLARPLVDHRTAAYRALALNRFEDF